MCSIQSLGLDWQTVTSGYPAAEASSLDWYSSLLVWSWRAEAFTIHALILLKGLFWCSYWLVRWDSPMRWLAIDVVVQRAGSSLGFHSFGLLCIVRSTTELALGLLCLCSVGALHGSAPSRSMALLFPDVFKMDAYEVVLALPSSSTTSPLFGVALLSTCRVTREVCFVSWGSRILVLACNAFAVLGLQYCRPVCNGQGAMSIN